LFHMSPFEHIYLSWQRRIYSHSSTLCSTHNSFETIKTFGPKRRRRDYQTGSLYTRRLGWAHDFFGSSDATFFYKTRGLAHGQTRKRVAFVSHRYPSINISREFAYCALDGAETVREVGGIGMSADQICGSSHGSIVGNEIDDLILAIFFGPQPMSSATAPRLDFGVFQWREDTAGYVRGPMVKI